MNIASIIDHTNLKATATHTDIKTLCDEAFASGFASVCVNPVNVKYAASLLNHTGTDDVTGLKSVAVCTVIGFPLGASSPKVKAFEATCAIEDGATEVDMVIDIGAAKEGRWDDVEFDIRQVVEASRKTAQKCNLKHGVIVKVIVEICYLTDEQTIEACRRAVKAGADFVKTSTGFGTPGKDKDGNSIPNGATTERVALMRQTVGSEIGVKAAGGIRDKETTLSMIKAGASRIGTSAGITIIS